MKILHVAAPLACLLIALPAQARRPFEDSDLFTGHSIRQSSKDRKLAFGMNVHAAPIPFVARKALDSAVNGAKQAGYADAESLVSVLRKSDATKVHELAAAGNVDGVKAQLKSDLKKAGVTPTADQTKAIDGISKDNIDQVSAISLVCIGGTSGDDSAFVFGLEPWAEYNFGTYDLTGALPLAGIKNSDGTNFAVGNLSLDLRAGSRRSAGAAGIYLPLAIGWTGGLNLYLPTGSADANKVALSNVLALPKYLHEYATVQPYGIFAAEASIIAFMLRLEFSHMQAMRGNPQYSKVGYLNWGASTVIRAFIFDLVGELDGLVEMYNAPAMNDIYGTFGGRLNVGPVRLGLGARMPLTTHKSAANDQSFGVSFANIAKLNVLLQGILTF